MREFGHELIIPLWNSQFDGAKEVASLAEQTFALLYESKQELVKEHYTFYLDFVRTVLVEEEKEDGIPENFDRNLGCSLTGLGRMLEVAV
jgi:hypothetical protein